MQARLRELLAGLARTPLHPQWLLHRREAAQFAAIAAVASGRLLDVGCGRRDLAARLREVECIGLDHPGTGAHYRGRPQVWGDAGRLPFATASMDALLLLDVLEHLERPEAALAEAARVLRPGGRLLLQVPFLYPLHDRPGDFRRWTDAGLEVLAVDAGFRVEHRETGERPLETATLLVNLALCRGVLDWLARRHPAALLALPLLGLLLPGLNLGGWLLARALPRNDFMPQSYRFRLVRLP